MNNDRAARLASAKSAARLAGSDLADFAASLIFEAAPRLVQGEDRASEVLENEAARRGVPDAFATDSVALALSTLSALCGSVSSFECLSDERKGNVIRYAVAALGTATDASTGWGPTVPALTRIWSEVEAA